MATTAARVRLGNGAIKIIELFTDKSRKEVDFRGLPAHLDDLTIQITEGIERTSVEPDTATEIENRIMFEYAIGARQELWPGAEPLYSKESNDPRSNLYSPFN